MKLKRNRLNKYWHRRAVPKRDEEGGSYIEYDAAESFDAEMWPGGGKTQSEIYGIRLPNIRNLRIQGEYHEVPGKNGKVGYRLDNGTEITAGDGICICTGVDQEPDYQVVAVYPYSHLILEVEKR